MEHLWWEDYTLSWLDGTVWGGCYLDGECCLGSHTGSWLRGLGLAELSGNIVLFAGGPNGLRNNGLPLPMDHSLMRCIDYCLAGCSLAQGGPCCFCGDYMPGCSCGHVALCLLP